MTANSKPLTAEPFRSISHHLCIRVIPVYVHGRSIMISNSPSTAFPQVLFKLIHPSVGNVSAVPKFVHVVSKPILGIGKHHACPERHMLLLLKGGLIQLTYNPYSYWPLLYGGWPGQSGWHGGQSGWGGQHGGWHGGQGGWGGQHGGWHGGQGGWGGQHGGWHGGQGGWGGQHGGWHGGQGSWGGQHGGSHGGQGSWGGQHGGWHGGQGGWDDGQHGGQGSWGSG
ncbi:MAG: hypothetical protein K0R28_3462, partial [Paenibacillus sp.]|nr:hypothetical protein [Paenibacillus sp.]